MNINYDYHHPITRLSIAITFILFLLLVQTAYAEGPVVCASGSGNITLTDYALSTCGVPSGQPVYVILKVKSPPNNSRAILAEGGLTCNVTASQGGSADCAVTVRDGVLDSAQTNNTPENYQLIASWSLSTPETYTSTLTSGDVFTIERTSTYGERFISGLLIFIALLQILGLALLFIRSR